MGDILEVSSAELKSKAEKIQESAQKIENVIREKMMAHLSDMAGKGNKIWCGPASVQFKEKYRDECRAVLKDVVTSINKEAENVITAANNYAKNEQQNEEITASLPNDLTSIF